MKLNIIFLFLILKIIFTFGEESVCSYLKEYDYSRKTRKISVSCQSVENMKDVHAIFNKGENFEPVSTFSIVSCTTDSLPNFIFWNTSIKFFDSVCPFQRIENDALSPIADLISLNLHFTKFTKIPLAIRKLTKLQILHINHGKLNGIDTELENMTGLLNLKLINNEISQISLEAFSKNSNLIILELSQNKLLFLYPGTFDRCGKLAKIVLQKLPLKSIDGLFNIQSLKELHLEGSNLRSIDDAFQKDILLKHLYLNSNPLREIKSSAFNPSVKHLHVLTLRECELKLLPPSVFRCLTKLNHLDLSNNLIESLPVEIFHGLNLLYSVDLSENRISYLGEVFRHNHHLRIVKLTSNNLQTIKNLFRGLQYLNTVDLKYNNLTVITDTDFSSRITMRTLNLSNNSIHRIDSNAFLNLTGLIRLSLEFNKLTTLNGSLRNFHELKFFCLHHNLLTEIKPSEMSNMKKLVSLDLSNNNITNVYKAFRNLIRLKILNLSGNNLSTISKSSFPPKLKIRKISTGDNPWICDCRFSWLREIRRLAKQFQCIFPLKFYKQKMTQLTSYDLNRWNNNCDSSCECTCVPQDNEFFIRVDCSGRSLTQVPFALPEETCELHLQKNLLSNLTNLEKHSLDRLKYLDVEDNLITKIDISLPKNLETLKLARNYLTRFMSFFPPSIINWTLSENPWICDCETEKFREFLSSKSQNIPDVDSITCSNKAGKPDLNGKIICYLTKYELCPEILRLYILLGVGISVLTLTAIGCHLVYTRYRYHLKVWLYSQGFSFLKKRDNRDAGKKHDAYLCFSDEDLEFVREHILPELEGREPFYSLFVPPRDMQAGRFEIDQQLEEMNNSKRTIVIVSLNFIDNELNMEIFRVAFSSGLEEKKYRIIAIIVGTLPPFSELDPSLKVALESTKCLRFGQKLFWEMIRYAMPEKSQRTESSGSEDDIDMPLLKVG